MNVDNILFTKLYYIIQKVELTENKTEPESEPESESEPEYYIKQKSIIIDCL